MGLAMAFGYISNSIRGANETLTEAEINYYKYMIARSVARNAVHRSLRYIDRGTNPPPTTGAFNNGTYTVSTKTSVDTMWMDVTGTYAASTYTMFTKLLLGTKPFPGLTGAVGVRANSLDLAFKGGATVDGRNYTEDGSALSSSCPDKPGFSVMNSTDSTTAAGYSSSITGSPKVQVDTTTSNPDAYMDEYEQNADYTFTKAGTYSGGTYGTASAPKITVCNPGEDTSFSIKFTGGFNGWGILAVNGNVNFNGGIDFHGLIVVYGKNNIVDFGASGTPQITGGLIIAGKAAKVTFKGTGSNGKVAYSCDALNKAKNLPKLRYYAVQEWYEPY
jgi:hypothetical protein